MDRARAPRLPHPPASAAWVLDHVRAGQEAVEAEILAAGFRKVEQHDLLRDNDFVRFEKTER